MDIILDVCDTHFFTPYVYDDSWPIDSWQRQLVSLLLITNVSSYLLYLTFATLSYLFMFDKELMRHPKILPNQIAKEMWVACSSIPFMSLPTCLIFLAEVRGHSRLYSGMEEYGVPFFAMSAFFFLFFTDMCIYWIHRWLHLPIFYKHIHKPHHRWLVPTPFASHAFHPVDGFLQSLPYHIYPFLFPLHKGLYLGLFMFVNMWTISIHDNNFKVPSALEPAVNGAAHHTDHHLYFDYNYGQFFTLWDRIGGSFRYPTSLEGNGPKDDLLKINSQKSK